MTGASERDREFEARLRREVPPIVNGVSVEFLAGLPSATLLKRLSVLGADSLVFTPGFFECTTAFSTDLPVGWSGHNG